MSTIFQEGDGAGSSRRVMAIILPAVLCLGGLGIIVFAVAKAIIDQWPYIAGLVCIGLGLIYSLFLFQLINATDLKEIASGLSKKE